MSLLWGFIQSFFSQILQVVTYILTAILNLFGAIFYHIFSAFLAVIEAFVSSINFVEYQTLSAVADWTNLPPGIIWLLDYMDFGTCLSLLAVAYTIRLMLNLIPGVLTRI